MVRVKSGFSTLLDIDKLILLGFLLQTAVGFSTLLDIDKLILNLHRIFIGARFSTLLDIDKLIPSTSAFVLDFVLVLCWILINFKFTLIFGSICEYGICHL